MAPSAKWEKQSGPPPPQACFWPDSHPRRASLHGPGQPGLPAARAVHTFPVGLARAQPRGSGWSCGLPSHPTCPSFSTGAQLTGGRCWRHSGAAGKFVGAGGAGRTGGQPWPLPWAILSSTALGEGPFHQLPTRNGPLCQEDPLPQWTSSSGAQLPVCTACSALGSHRWAPEVGRHRPHRCWLCGGAAGRDLVL